MKSPSILILIVIVSTQCGCSSLITRSGKNVEACKTRDEIRDMLGTPVETGVNKNGEDFDQFVSHKKIREDDTRWNSYVKSTFGFGEFVALPSAIYRSTTNVVSGQDLRVIYDAKGNITRMSSNTVQLTPEASLVKAKPVDPNKVPPVLAAKPVTRGIQDPTKIVEVVLKQNPAGTPVVDAKKFMEREGFHCKPMTNQVLGDRVGLDYLDCDRYEGGTSVQRVSHLAIVYQNGKVMEVLNNPGPNAP